MPQAVAFITRHWTPEGHDEAARLAAALRARSRVEQADLERLAALYAAQGRSDEARRTLRGKP